MLNKLDLEKLRTQFAEASPFPYVMIDNFLVAEAAKEIADSYPRFDSAIGQGRSFTTVNERKKVQETNSSVFPAPVAELNKLLASPGFLNVLSYITNIPHLLADDEWVCGGSHITRPGGRHG